MRKRKSKAAAIPIEEKSGLSGLIVSHPREFVGLLFGSAAILTIFGNALFMQKGPHPAPIFAPRTTPVVAAPVPAPAPVPMDARPSVAQPLVMPAQQPAAPALNRVQLTAEIQRELTKRGFYDGTADGIWGAKTDASARNFLQSSGLKLEPAPSEDLLRALNTPPNARGAAATAPAARRDPIADLIAAPSQRLLAIQRALTEFGYGQIRPTGVFDQDTRTAIEKFERDRRLPVTGQMSDRIVREMATMTGRSID